MNLNPEFLVGLTVLAVVAIYLFLTRPKPPSPTPSMQPSPMEWGGPLIQAAPPDHASDALAALERAERQAAARRLGDALGQHHLGQLGAAMGLAIHPPAQPQSPPQPPFPAPKA